jgi:hypothetical protein
MSNSESAIALPAPAQGESMSSLAIAWSVLIEPSRAFAALRNRPVFWFPLLALVVVNVLVLLWYFGIVDYAWLTDQMVQGQPHAQAANSQAAPLVSKGALMGSLLASVILGMPLMRVLEATYFSLACKIVDVQLGFRHWLALACWTAWPYIISIIVMMQPLLMHRDGQIAFDALNLLSLNELIFHVPQTSSWHGLASTLTILHPWVWALTVLGVRQWSGRSIGFSAVLALLPEVLLYGGWAIVDMS